MTIEQKEYIEENIDLIENHDWEEFFTNSPDCMGAVLHEAGIDFMSELGYIPCVAFQESNIKTIDIPDSVTSIGDWAFAYCSSLTSIEIPNSVTNIGVAVFYNCARLDTISYKGTVEEWENMIGNNDTVFRNTQYTCNCTDGIVKN